MSNTNSSARKGAVLGGMIGAAALAASLLAFTGAVSAQDNTTADETVTEFNLDAAVTGEGEVADTGDVPADAEIIEIDDADAVHLGDEEGEGEVAGTGDIPADAEINDID